MVKKAKEKQLGPGQRGQLLVRTRCRRWVAACAKRSSVKTDHSGAGGRAASRGRSNQGEYQRLLAWSWKFSVVSCSHNKPNSLSEVERSSHIDHRDTRDGIWAKKGRTKKAQRRRGSRDTVMGNQQWSGNVRR